MSYKLGMLGFIFLIVSCDAVQKDDGVVLDKETLKPLNNVSISHYAPEDTKDTDYCKSGTDINGRFNYNCMGFTNKFNLYFSRIGYFTKKVSVTSRSVTMDDTIMLERDHKTDSAKSNSL